MAQILQHRRHRIPRYNDVNDTIPEALQRKHEARDAGQSEYVVICRRRQGVDPVSDGGDLDGGSPSIHEQPGVWG